jgi:hypothetical protein
MGLLVQTLMRGIKDGSIRSDLDPLATAFCVSSSFHGVLSALESMGTEARKPGISEENIITALFDLFTTSLRSGGPKTAGKGKRTGLVR